MNALLVDDEQEICLLLSNVLRREGTHCVVAHTLGEARTALDSGHFDMVFLDVHLPDGLGYELVPGIKSAHPNAVSIVISAMDTEADRALEAGADLFITKPFDRSTLLSSIRTLGLSI